MALNDILSVFRQSLIGERQNRLTELQISMQGLQFEATQNFREEGREREDLVATLDYATNKVGQTISTDASNIYSSLYNMSDAKGKQLILRDDENQLKKPQDSLSNLVEVGFSVQDSKDIYNIIQMYQSAQNNPKVTGMARGAEMAAVSLAKRFSRDYDEYKRSGYDDKIGKSSFLKAMEKGNVLFKGVDSFRKDLSVDSFLGATAAVNTMANIEKERFEIAEGDYTIDTPISVTGLEDKSIEELNYNSVFQQAENALLKKSKDSKPIQVDLSNPDFMEDFQLQSEINLKDAESKIKSIQSSLSNLEDDKFNIGILKKTKDINPQDAIDEIKEISNKIKDSKSEIDSLNTLVKEQKANINTIDTEQTQREYDKKYGQYNRRPSQYRF